MRRVFWLVAAALLLAGCAGEKGIVEKEGYQLDTRRQAQAAYPRIKVLVIHYTADDFDSSLATLTDKQVSSHYLVPADHRDTTVNRASGNWCRNKNWPGMRGLAPGAGQRALTTPLLALSWKTVAGKNRPE